MDKNEFFELANGLLQAHGLLDQRWAVALIDEFENGGYGFTDTEAKLIIVSQAHWPTPRRNVVETVLHEIAHALCGHGDHTLDWWDTLTDIGGKGVWVEDPDNIKNIYTTVVYR